MKELLENFESAFCKDAYMGDSSAKTVFKHLVGNTSVFLTAPHSTSSFVYKKKKIADIGTGAIVSLLHHQYNIYVVLRNKYVAKKALISNFLKRQKIKPKFILDIHSCHNENHADLIIGTGIFFPKDYEKIILKANELGDKYGIKVCLNHPRYRGGLHCLIGRFKKLYKRPNILQLEWRKDYRDFYSCPQKVLGVTIPFLKDMVDFLEDNL